MLKFARIIYKIKLLLGLNQASTQVTRNEILNNLASVGKFIS